MDEVALVASEQQKFQKSIKGIKKLLKSGKIKPRTDKDAIQATQKLQKREKKPKKEKGLVYISHIPHGFYENEMTQYFRQFGVVTNVRVLRSRRTGFSKGAAFVEFLEPTVAEIVAETMNNYLMGKRLLKAVLIPPEKQKTKAMRKNWNSFENPCSNIRRNMKKIHNEDGTDEDDLKLARKQLKNVLQAKKKLKELGIDYDFFQPVDVPAQLCPLLSATSNKEDEKTVKVEVSNKLEKKKEKVNVEQVKKENKKEKIQVVKGNDKLSKKEKNKDIKNGEDKSQKKEKFEGQNFIKINTEKKKKQNDEVKISNDEDESSDQFDSDEFENMLDSDDEFDSGDDNNDNSEQNDDSSDGDIDLSVNEGESDIDDSDDDASEEEPPPKLTKNIKKSNPKNIIQKNKRGLKQGVVEQRNSAKRTLELKPVLATALGKKKRKHNNNAAKK